MFREMELYFRKFFMFSSLYSTADVPLINFHSIKMFCTPKTLCNHRWLTRYRIPKTYTAKILQSLSSYLFWRILFMEWWNQFSAFSGLENSILSSTKKPGTAILAALLVNDMVSCTNDEYVFDKARLAELVGEIMMPSKNRGHFCCSPSVNRS